MLRSTAAATAEAAAVAAAKAGSRELAADVVDFCSTNLTLARVCCACATFVFYCSLLTMLVARLSTKIRLMDAREWCRSCRRLLVCFLLSTKFGGELNVYRRKSKMQSCSTLRSGEFERDDRDDAATIVVGSRSSMSIIAIAQRDTCSPKLRSLSKNKYKLKIPSPPSRRRSAAHTPNAKPKIAAAIVRRAASFPIVVGAPFVEIF